MNIFIDTIPNQCINIHMRDWENIRFNFCLTVEKKIVVFSFEFILGIGMYVYWIDIILNLYPVEGCIGFFFLYHRRNIMNDFWKISKNWSWFLSFNGARWQYNFLCGWNS